MEWLTVVLGLLTIVGTVGGTLGGAWWGANISQRGALQLHEQERREQEAARDTELRNVVTLLRLEIDHNRAMLLELWNKVRLNLTGDSTEQAFQSISRFVTEPMPKWGHLMWETQAARLPDALDESVIRGLYELYTQLESLTQLQAMLTARMPKNLIYDYSEWKHFEQQEQARGRVAELSRAAFFPTMTAFLADRVGRDIWTRCYGIMNGINSVSNTIGE
jgi:hypothetical protein